MTVNSFIIPYPKKNRFSVWFTGGFVEVNGGAEKWHSMFSRDSTPKRTLGERAMLFAAGLLMGATANDEMDENGRLSFELTRPAAGNIDLLYMDEILRVMRTSKGTTYVFARANPQDYSSSDESNTSYTSRESSSSLENSSKSLNLDGTNAPSRPLRHSSPPRNGNGTPRHPVRCPSPPRNQNAPPRRPGRSRSPVLHVPETYMPEEDLCDSGSRWTDSTSGAPKCTNHEAPSPVERTPTGHKGDGNGRWTGTDSFAPRPPSRHTSPKGKAPSTAGAPRRPSRQISPRRKVSTSTVILQLPSRSISPATRDTEEEGIPFIFPLDASPKTTR